MRIASTVAGVVAEALPGRRKLLLQHTGFDATGAATTATVMLGEGPGLGLNNARAVLGAGAYLELETPSAAAREWWAVASTGTVRISSVEEF